MALLHHATLSPTKRELLDGWLPTRSWFDGDLERDPVASFRLDDPDDEVGVECLLLGGPAGALFVPLTYRSAELAGAEEHLVGTTEHSVLGTRWVYDGCGDPVFASVLATTILSGGTQALEEFEVDGKREAREPKATAQGSGSAEAATPEIDSAGPYDEGDLTIVNAGPLELAVVRRLGAEVEAAETLTVTWPGGTHIVAGVRPA